MSTIAATSNPLQGGTVIEQAQNALSVRLGVSLETAFRMIDGAARSHSRQIDDVAAEVVANGGRFCRARRSFGRRQAKEPGA
jgi:AmiR/NasT family two-component response regulator